MNSFADCCKMPPWRSPLALCRKGEFVYVLVSDDCRYIYIPIPRNMSGDGRPSSSQAVRGILQGISIRLDRLCPILVRTHVWFRCEKACWVSCFVCVLVHASTSEPEQLRPRQKQTISTTEKTGLIRPGGLKKNRDVYCMCPGLAVKARPPWRLR